MGGVRVVCGVVRGVVGGGAAWCLCFLGRARSVWGWGRELYGAFPVFAGAVVDGLCGGLMGLLGCSLRGVCLRGEGSSGARCWIVWSYAAVCCLCWRWRWRVV